MFARAMRLRCPRCGARGVLAGWMRMRDRCPGCGLALERGEAHDYWLGAYAMNLVFAETFAVVMAFVALALTFPALAPAMWVGGTLAVVAPIAFFPFSRTLWLAWDLSFRRNEVGDDAHV